MLQRNPGLAAKLEAERRLKEGISGHKTGLPKKLLELFNARPVLEKKTDLKKPKPKVPHIGLAKYVSEFVEPEDPDYEPGPPKSRPSSPRRYRNPEMRAQARIDEESKLEKMERVGKQQLREAKANVEDEIKDWDPSKDANVAGDPFKTLFIGRISFDATEKKLRREFEEFGPIKRIRLVHTKSSGKPRGYAFIEFEHKNDMKTAYKMGDGKKIEGRRVLVDVERGRTVPNWRPRRLGGGKGGESREPKEPKNPTKRVSAGLPARPLPGSAIAAPSGPPMRDERPPMARDDRPPMRDDRGPPADRRGPPRDMPPRDREMPPSDRKREREPYPDRPRDRERDGRRERDRDDARPSKRPRDDDGGRPERRRERDVL